MSNLATPSPSPSPIPSATMTPSAVPTPTATEVGVPASLPPTDVSVSFDVGFLNWLGIVVSLLIAIAGSRVVATVIDDRRKRVEFSRADARETMVSLGKARAVYLKYGYKPGGTTVNMKRDLEIMSVGADLVSTAALTSTAVYEAAKAYVKVGELFAANDADTSTSAEDDAFHALVAVLGQHHKKKPKRPRAR